MNRDNTIYNPLAGFKNLKYLSLLKIYNYILLKIFFNLRLILPNYKSIARPVSLSFEPTNHCNLHCPECPSGNGEMTRERGYMDLDLFKRIIDENKKSLISIILHFQGEPLLHKQLAEFVNYAELNNIYTILSTNAQILDKHIDDLSKSGLQKLIISLDGLSDESYKKYRKNADIQKVISSLDRIGNLKKKPFVELQFLVFSHNEHEIKDLAALKSKFKINRIAIKTAQISKNKDLIPKNEKYSRYKNINEFELKAINKKSCFRMFSSAVITWDGIVVPCCFDKNADYNLGESNKNSFIDIWKSKKYNELRDKIFSDKKSVSMCNNCSENIKQCIRYI